jgi:hypothetical protein
MGRWICWLFSGVLETPAGIPVWFPDIGLVFGIAKAKKKRGSKDCFLALSIVSPCAYVHAHSHCSAAPPSTTSSTKAGSGGGPHMFQLAQGRQLCARPKQTTAIIPPVPVISRGHREESGGSCTQPNAGGQRRPPCSMRHKALVPRADFLPAPLLQKAADEPPPPVEPP